MIATLLDEKHSKFSLSGECPHCHRGSVFVPATTTNVRKVSASRDQWATALECQGCRKFVLGVVEKQGSRLEYKEHYPLGAPDDSVDKDVPEPMASDFAEALRCLWVKSPKAAVAMCRRSVEAACHNLGAKGWSLKDKINDLAKKGLITEPLKMMAHRVRLTANTELHKKDKKKEQDASAESGKDGQKDENVEAPQAVGDDLATFGENDAEAMIVFVRQFFQHVYVMPALLKSYDKSEIEGTSGNTNAISSQA